MEIRSLKQVVDTSRNSQSARTVLLADYVRTADYHVFLDRVKQALTPPRDRAGRKTTFNWGTRFPSDYHRQEFTIQDGSIIISNPVGVIQTAVTHFEDALGYEGTASDREWWDEVTRIHPRVYATGVLDSSGQWPLISTDLPSVERHISDSQLIWAAESGLRGGAFLAAIFGQRSGRRVMEALSDEIPREVRDAYEVRVSGTDLAASAR